MGNAKADTMMIVVRKTANSLQGLVPPDASPAHLREITIGKGARR